MKKTTLLLAFLVLLGGTAMAQTQSNPQRIWKNITKQLRGDKWVEIYRPAHVIVDNGDALYRYCYTYDEDYLLTTIDEQVLEENNEWTTLVESTFEYGFNGNVIEVLTMDVVNDEGISLESITYDGPRVSEDLFQEWDGNNWVGVSKDVYNYGDDGTVIVLTWIYHDGTWSPMYTYTYTDNGNSVELLMQYMQGGAWQNEARQTTTFNDDDNVEEILTEYWDNNTWTNVYLKNYYYSDGLYEMVVESIWEGKGWSETAKSRYTYDEHGDAVTGESFCEDAGEWQPCYGTLEMAYDYNTEFIEYSGFSFQATYIDVTGVEEGLVPNSFTFYPNPVNDVLTIKTDDFQKAEVYSLTGAKLTESRSNYVDVSHLSAGMYLLKVYGQETGCKARVFVVR